MKNRIGIASAILIGLLNQSNSFGMWRWLGFGARTQTARVKPVTTKPASISKPRSRSRVAKPMSVESRWIKKSKLGEECLSNVQLPWHALCPATTIGGVNIGAPYKFGEEREKRKYTKRAKTIITSASESAIADLAVSLAITTGLATYLTYLLLAQDDEQNVHEKETADLILASIEEFNERDADLKNKLDALLRDINPTATPSKNVKDALTQLAVYIKSGDTSYSIYRLGSFLTPARTQQIENIKQALSDLPIIEHLAQAERLALLQLASESNEQKITELRREAARVHVLNHFFIRELSITREQFNLQSLASEWLYTHYATPPEKDINWIEYVKDPAKAVALFTWREMVDPALSTPRAANDYVNFDRKVKESLGKRGYIVPKIHQGQKTVEELD